MSRYFAVNNKITHHIDIVSVWERIKYNTCISGAGEGNRTLATSLEGWGSTIELHPHIRKWSEQQDSNLRPPGPKPGALPNCAMPRYLLSIVTNHLNCPWETLFRYRLLRTVTTNI